MNAFIYTKLGKTFFCFDNWMSGSLRAPPLVLDVSVNFQRSDNLKYLTFIRFKPRALIMGSSHISQYQE